MAEAVEDNPDIDVTMTDNIAPKPYQPAPLPSNKTQSNNDCNDDDIDSKQNEQLYDTEQAQINAFIDDDDTNNELFIENANTKHNSNHGLFNYIGKIFKKKKKKNSNDLNNYNDNNEDILTSPIAAQTHQNEEQLSDLVGGNIPWNCEKCTFMNAGTELHCVMCFYSRFEVKNLPAQWQWKAADRWITYGIPETIEIENAYKNGDKWVSLTKGWFVSNPSLYKIYFDEECGDNKHKKKAKKHHNKNDEHHEYDDNWTYFYQINSDTSTRREVRRIGSDDDNLFKKLSMNELDEKDRKCMICLHEFSVKDEANQCIVQLSTCTNHGFHKECIVQWVQLKGNCPLCRIDVDT